MLLLLSSIYFYLSFIPIFILVLVSIILIGYFTGLLIENNNKLFLIIGLIFTIIVLGFFKYYNFLNDNLTFLFSIVGIKNRIPHLSILLPIGLSFYSFISMSYIIEVSRGNQKPEKNLGIYALYIMFFPIILAGPIERPKNLLHQFYEKHEFDIFNIIEGFKLMIWGFFMKLVVADRLSIYVNAVYNNPQQHSGVSLLVATIFFSFQIYCDFAGYSNIAIGVGRILGFRLITNFNRPYFAKNITDFWTRWHISLSSWLRDYLFLPLSFYFSNKLRKEKYLWIRSERWIYILATMITFLLCGLWHGSQWTFVVWGGLHGVYLIMGNILKKSKKKFNQSLGISKNNLIKNGIDITIGFCIVTFAWIFFKANSLADAWLIFVKIVKFKGPLFTSNLSTLLYSVFGILFIFIIEFKQVFYSGRFLFYSNKRWIIQDLSCLILILIILLIGVFDGGEFIYFQF